MKAHFKAIILVNVLLSSACSTLSHEECTQGSWFELGLADGRKGKSYKRLGNYQKACSEYNLTVDTEQYNKGREQGINDYCQLDNAIEMGLKGRRYQSVCPSDIHLDFQRYNRVAYSLYKSKDALDKLDNKLSKKENKLVDKKLSDDERSKIRDRIRQLDRQRQKLRDDVYSNESKLDKLQRGNM